jgi:hypothetical protein
LLGLLSVLLLVLGLAPTRGWLLRTGLGIADGSLPGDLSWGRADWPAPGRVEIDHLLWTTAGDTLATVALARLQLQIAPFLQGEVVVDSLRVSGAWVDLAGVQAVMSDTAAVPADTTRQRALPRAALRSVVVRDVTVVTPSGPPCASPTSMPRSNCGPTTTAAARWPPASNWAGTLPPPGV